MIYDLDGYDDYPTAQLLREHPRVVGSPTIVSGGRNGGTRLSCAGRTKYVCRAVPGASPASLVVGAYLYTSALPVYLLDVRDATSSQVLIMAEADGAISAYRSLQPSYDFGSTAGGWRTLLGTSAAGAVAAGVPFHLQVAVTVSDTVGTVEVRVNGVPILALTDQDTRNGTTTITNVLIGNGNLYSEGADATVYIDDLWLASDFLGDRRVDSHYPTDDGALQDGTPSTPGDHFALVDEATPDDDSGYVSLASPDDAESYEVEEFKNPGAPIDAVLVAIDARKENAGDATLAGLVYQAAAAYAGDAQGLGMDYGRTRTIFEVDPASTDPWDETSLNAAEFGYQKIA